ncbi:MAG: aminotransferase class I/II-fold pyridoxal phosphate-dependent enzyme [Nitrospinota bacterium]
MDLFSKCQEFTSARDLIAAGLYPYYRVLTSAQEPEVIVDGRRMIMIGSNNYLGLASHPQVKEAAMAAVEKYGTSCAGARPLNGTLAIHEELERKLASFFRKEAAVIFPTGFLTNLGAISALVGRGDTVIVDKMDHASIVDGCRLSYGQVKRFRHNDMDHLESTLRTCGTQGKLVVVDGVFSMEGDITDLPNIMRLCQRYGARLMVDDAHGIGVLGAGGRGTAEHFGLEAEVDIIMGTYSKSLAAIGGFIATSESVAHYIRHHARPFIFSASLVPACVGAASAAVDIVEREPERRARLWEHTRKMKEGFDRLGLNTGKSETPIIPVIFDSDAEVLQFWRMLHRKGVFANAILGSAAPTGAVRLRTSYMSTHTEAQLDCVLGAFEEILSDWHPGRDR